MIPECDRVRRWRGRAAGVVSSSARGTQRAASGTSLLCTWFATQLEETENLPVPKASQALGYG